MAVNLAENEREKKKQPETPALGLSQFLLQFYEDVPVGLFEMETEQVRQVLHAGIAMEVYYQKDERVHHIVFRSFIYSKLFTGYVDM